MLSSDNRTNLSACFDFEWIFLMRNSVSAWISHPRPEHDPVVKFKRFDFESAKKLWQWKRYVLECCVNLGLISDEAPSTARDSSDVACAVSRRCHSHTPETAGR